MSFLGHLELQMVPSLLQARNRVRQDSKYQLARHKGHLKRFRVEHSQGFHKKSDVSRKVSKSTIRNHSILEHLDRGEGFLVLYLDGLCLRCGGI
jgi:hypothetical protein